MNVNSMSRGPKFEDLQFEVQHQTDVYRQQKGLEQMLYDVFGPPHIGLIEIANKSKKCFWRMKDK